ncbi:MAG TPA: hypothetical protein VFA56_13730 [Gaiellaceae bacterium]|nr:hypothetical protein [Gaiellaceae bacterium]
MKRRWRLAIPGRRHGAVPAPLERALGPVAPQVSCDECFAQIDRYVELEAAGNDVAALFPTMRAHLDGCPACREEHDDLLAFVSAR